MNEEGDKHETNNMRTAPAKASRSTSMRPAKVLHRLHSDSSVRRSHTTGGSAVTVSTHRTDALDETNITHHRLINERLRKIAAHLILALLPAFHENARQEKEAKKERAEKAESEHEEAERPVPAHEEPAPALAAEPSVVETPAPQTKDVTVEDSPSKPKPTDATEAPAPETSSLAQMDIEAQPSGSGSGGEAPSATETPDDMREEVLNPLVREQRAMSAIPPHPEESQISDEFLDPLRPDICADILMQESTDPVA
ncbi:hypothetical protein FRC11_008149 [Ceratobasidium sp. 423]|nr:hypothetical protein FRC11_008149 [Ceratobasidium sp. 423]